MTSSGQMTIRRTDAPNGDTTVEIFLKAPRSIAEKIERAILFDTQKEQIKYVKDIEEA